MGSGKGIELKISAREKVKVAREKDAHSQITVHPCTGNRGENAKIYSEEG